LAAEKVTNIGLEEVKLDEDDWLVTVGFSRPWDYPSQEDPARAVLFMLPRAEGTPAREYKVVRVDAATGEVRGMALRQENA